MKVLLTVCVCTVLRGCLGYKISECGSDGKVDLDEARPTVLTCTGITDGTVKWEVKRGDSNFTAATCTWPTSPCSVDFASFTAELTEHNTSTLTVTLKDRNSITGMIRCGGSAIGSSSATCKIRIVHKADKVTNCRVTVEKDWTVTAACEVDRMYASDDEYSCKWVVPKQHGNKTLTGTLSKTIFTENNKEYTRGTCVISGLPMPTADGIYNYSVIIDPGVGLLAGHSLEIKQPGNPTLLSDCPDSMTEGQNYDCTCQASNSSPPAVITWYAGMSNHIRVLRLTNVSSELDGTNYTCTQHWGGVSPKLVTYTLHVKSVPTPTTPTTKPTNTVLTTTNNAYTEDETIRERSNNNNNDNTKDEGLPIAIIAGGAGGGLVVIIIIVVVVVVVKKRRGGSSTEQRKVDTADNDVEEHMNDMYESPDARAYAGSSHVLSGHNASNAGITTEPSTVNEESETAFGYLTVISPVPQTTASAQQHNQILESDLYSSPDENGAQPPVAIATQAAPKDADVYAVVNKSDKAISTLTMVTPTEPKGAEVYAVVNKPDKNKPTPTMVTPTEPKGAEVYAVVNKPGKAKPQETPESQIDEHAVADKARSEPKNSEGLETTISAEGETEYGSGHVYSQVNKTSPQN